jgi:hypothetical protein
MDETLPEQFGLREFFQFIGMRHPSEVVPNDVVLWRDRLRSQKKSAATVAFKLSVVRSFFEYLKAAGAVPLNPASTKLVPPPELPGSPRPGRSPHTAGYFKDALSPSACATRASHDSSISGRLMSPLSPFSQSRLASSESGH